MKKIIFLSILLFSMTDLLAAYELESILHTQEKTSVDTESSDDTFEISSESLEDTASSSSNIDEILKAVSSATTARGPRSSSESPQVRGLDDNKIYVKIDGARENFQDGHSSFIALDTENLKKVKVNKSSARISETGSIGGGVEFVTKSADDFLKNGKDAGSEFSVKTSSVNQERSYNAKAISRLNSYSHFISLSSADAGDSRLSNGERLDNSSYQDVAGLYKADLLDKYSLKLEYFKRNDDAPTDPSLNPPSRFNDLQSDNTTIKTSVNLGYKDKDFKVRTYFSSYEQEKIDRETKEATTKKIETTSLKVDKSQASISFGAELYKDKLFGVKKSQANESDTAGYPNAESDNYMGYASKNIALNESLELDFGLRLDSYRLSAQDSELDNKSASDLSKSFGIKARPTNEIETFVNYSEGFNAPSLNEVYPTGLHIPSDDEYFRNNVFIPNEDLVYEKSSTREIGLKYQTLTSETDIIEFGISFYESKVKNYITREQLDKSIFDDEDGTTQFVNIKNVTLYGAEVSANYNRDDLSLGMTYSKVRGQDLKTNEFIQDLPADEYRLSTKYYLDKYDLNLGHELSYTEEQNRVNPNTLQRTGATPDYLVHNIFVQKTIQDIRLDFRINNLSNIKYKKHASFLYETERDYKFGLKYKINTF